MMAYETNVTPSIPLGMIEIPAANVTAGGQQVEVPHPDGLRFFVRKDSSGNILPNSLIATRKRPAGDLFEFKVLRNI